MGVMRRVRVSFVILLGVAAACRLAHTATALDNGVGTTPAMGYSSWNDCSSDVTEERIKNITLALIKTGLAAKVKSGLLQR